MKEILNTENGSYETTFTDKYRAQKPWTAHDPRQILSFIPGTITSLDVKTGDRVKKGDKLLMFNAMKMENTLYAPQDGVIDELCVTVGQAVPKGVVMVIFK